MIHENDAVPESAGSAAIAKLLEAYSLAETVGDRSMIKRLRYGAMRILNEEWPQEPDIGVVSILHSRIAELEDRLYCITRRYNSADSADPDYAPSVQSSKSVDGIKSTQLKLIQVERNIERMMANPDIYAFLFRHKLGPPPTTIDPDNAADDAESFVKERCAVMTGLMISSRDLYFGYRDWCKETLRKPQSQVALGMWLRASGFEQTLVGPVAARVRTWLGIGLHG